MSTFELYQKLFRVFGGQSMKEREVVVCIGGVDYKVTNADLAADGKFVIHATHQPASE